VYLNEVALKAPRTQSVSPFCVFRYSSCSESRASVFVCAAGAVVVAGGVEVEVEVGVAEVVVGVLAEEVVVGVLAETCHGREILQCTPLVLG
jgi:hypothetical protein